MKLTIKEWNSFLEKELPSEDDYLDETEIYIGSRNEEEFSAEELNKLPEDTLVDVQGGFAYVNGEFLDLVKMVKRYLKTLSYETLIIKIPRGKSKEVKEFIKTLK